MLPWVCSVIDHRRRQNVVRTSVTHSAIASCATFLFLPHFDVICDLLTNRRTATWNLLVKHFTLLELDKSKIVYLMSKICRRLTCPLSSLLNIPEDAPRQDKLVFVL